jgi:hypothetical protein
MQIQDVIKAVKQANTTFKAIMVNYPGLKGYLVLSSPYGQCGLTTDPLQIFTEFPAMISESEGKAKRIKLLETIQGMESELKDAHRKNMKAEIQKKIAEKLLRFNANLEQTEFREDTFIEIRFKTQQLELIFAMQKDPLISQVHTPQTQASIQIVLGTLKELAQQAGDVGQAAMSAE